MLGIARGLVLVLTDASTVQPLPESFGDIAKGNLLGLPNLLWIFMIVAVVTVVVVVTAFVLRRTVLGRYSYAVGSNPESARLSGVPVTAVLVSVSAIAGLLAARRRRPVRVTAKRGNPDSGHRVRVERDRRVRDRGASLFGAKGGAFGAAAGALIVATINNGGNLLAVNAFSLQIIVGALFLIAVAFDKRQSRAK